MHSTFTTAATIGLACLSAVSAAPWGRTPPPSWYIAHPSPSTGPEEPFKFPLQNGFPNVTNPSSTLNVIEAQAHGTLPNAPPPPAINSANTFTSLRLIAFNEITEVAFFTELIDNITSNVPGYEINDSEGGRDFILETLTAVQAQEELHALFANEVLALFNAGPIQPCEYEFAVDTFESAIALASTFTDVVLGTLGDVVGDFGADGDTDLIRGVASVIAQEGEQNGLYRALQDKVPSALPFLTASTREFAFSALNQNFVVAGTCPNINTIDLPIFGALTVVTPPTTPTNQQVKFSFQSNGTSTSGLSLVYINQQNLPIVEPLTDISTEDGVVTFTAEFPGATNLMNGLTIAAVATGSNFTSADEVASATLFGPGLIEIN